MSGPVQPLLASSDASRRAQIYGVPATSISGDRSTSTSTSSSGLRIPQPLPSAIAAMFPGPGKRDHSPSGSSAASSSSAPITRSGLPAKKANTSSSAEADDEDEVILSIGEHDVITDSTEVPVITMADGTPVHVEIVDDYQQSPDLVLAPPKLPLPPSASPRIPAAYQVISATAT